MEFSIILSQVPSIATNLSPVLPDLSSVPGNLVSWRASPKITSDLCPVFMQFSVIVSELPPGTVNFPPVTAELRAGSAMGKSSRIRVGFAYDETEKCRCA
jgi:hypothetical protein